ncbi:DNA topoisomerase IB [Sphingosinicella sp. CPCC 101087]|uniref:DNA topoisomerase IB n=1 Tax=Sphingosinicella sp. CPCC 101087 TaxID=2497754 RepID=UPI0019806A27|nr:DNA topoisomerase IB [Sphingosinicella sp. CPCC 101087]
MNNRRGLCYVDDSMPGISRKRRGRYWQYFDARGQRITAREEIERLNAIGMPPAYERCWFCPDPNGHIQAIGYDAKGRKQYRYHPDFRTQQDSLKYERLAEFGRKLPKLRKRVEEDIKGNPTSYAAVIAAVIRLIDETHMRVGNEAYAKENKSFGATTLRNRHARVGGGRVRISYVGKSGIKRTIIVNDRRLARIARRTQDLPGQHLFEFLDEDGQPHPVTSSEVNLYIKEAMGEDFTAKDFRTWGASVIAFEEMVKRARGSGRIRLKAVIAPVAEALGNTPAISRKSYVHPALIEAVGDAAAIAETRLPRKSKYLSGAERGLIAFLDSLGSMQPSNRERADERQNGRSRSA